MFRKQYLRGFSQLKQQHLQQFLIRDIDWGTFIINRDLDKEEHLPLCQVLGVMGQQQLQVLKEQEI